MIVLIRSSALLLASLTLCVFLSSCTKSEGDDGGGQTSARPTSNTNIGEVTTDCGVVSNGSLENPVQLQDGENVRVVDVLGSNLLTIQSIGADVGGPVLVKLHGVASGPAQRQEAAMNVLSDLSRGTVTFYKADGECNVSLAGGGQGVIGQLVSGDGRSFSEALVKAGLVDVEPADSCGGDQIAGCLAALKGTGVTSAGEMADFLWKPESDTKGPILVIHELHCNTDAFVNGEKLDYRGSGNGRCGTFAGTRSGCGYGGNVKVEIIDKSTGQPYTRNGEPFVIIPNGCNRVEFK